MAGLQQHDPNEDGTGPHKCLRVTATIVEVRFCYCRHTYTRFLLASGLLFVRIFTNSCDVPNATIRPLLSAPQQIMVQRETWVATRKKPVLNSDLNVKSALSQLQVLRFHLTDEMPLLASGHEVASFYHLLMCLAPLRLAAEVSACIHNIVYHTWMIVPKWEMNAWTCC